MKFNFFLTLFFLVVVVMRPASAQYWKVNEVREMPVAVTNNAVTSGWLNDTALVLSFGGIDTTLKAGGIVQHAWAYNIVTDNWKAIPPLPDTLGKIASAASTIGDTVFIIGGYHVLAGGHEVTSNKVHRYRLSTETYLSDGQPVPVPVDDHVQLVWRDSLIILITGWSNTTNVNAVQVYDPKSDSWSTGTSVPNNDVYKSFGAAGAIVGDIIYYLGGASSDGVRNFPIQPYLRIGIIQGGKPLQISWSDTTLPANRAGYRMAATTAFGRVHWVGGAGATYNFNGLAYANGKGVEPNNRNLSMDPRSLRFFTDTSSTVKYPMDLRGIAKISDSLFFLAGGMESNQQVSRKTLRLDYRATPLGGNPHVRGQKGQFFVYPNPVKDYALVRVGVKGPYWLRLYSVDGLMQYNGQFNKKEVSLALGQFTPGTYVLQLVANGYTASRLLVVSP